MKHKKTIIFFDFETTWSKDMPEVYAWGLFYRKEGRTRNQNGRQYRESGRLSWSKNHLYQEREAGHFHSGINIKSFVEFLLNLKISVEVIGFNNRGFDNHFILPELKRQGLNQWIREESNFQEEESHWEVHLREERTKRIMEYVKGHILKSKTYTNRKEQSYESYITKAQNLSFIWNYVIPNEYKMLVDNNKKILELRIGLKSLTEKGIRPNTVLITDMLNLVPATVKQLGEGLNNSLVAQGREPIEYLSKKEIDYHRTHHYRSISAFKDDIDTYEYLFNDIFIIFSFYQEILKEIPKKDIKLTSGATSIHLWTQILGNKLLENQSPGNKGFIPITYKSGIKKYRVIDKPGTIEIITDKAAQRRVIKKLLPTAWLDDKHPTSEEINHNYLSNWYSGGLSKVNEKYRGLVVNNITKIDINSSYSYQMNKEDLVPYGKPVFKNTKHYNFNFYKLFIINKITNKTGLPWLTPGHFGNTHYKQTLTPGETYYLTDIDINNFNKYYNPKDNDIKISIEYSFLSIPINLFFKDYIMKMFELKKQGKEENNFAAVKLAKVLLNAPYGKMATKRERESRILNDDTFEWEQRSEILDSKFYLPMAVVISSLARQQLVEAVGNRYDKFVYADTDSIAIRDFNKEDFPKVKLDPVNLGAWDIEGDNLSGIFRRGKQYITKDKNGKLNPVFSGINFNRSLKNIKFEDFITGIKIDNQLRPHKSNSGVYLEEFVKEIKPVWDYKQHPEQHFWDKESYYRFVKNYSLKTRI